jgi:hypothetical protein
MAQIIEVTDTGKFKSTLDYIAAEQDFVIVYITGTTDESGKNWCPDCERAKPNIDNILLKNTQGKVIKCIVERAKWSGRSDHPYKQSPLLKAKGVPTVLLIREGEVLMRAERDEDFDNAELLLSIARHE